MSSIIVYIPTLITHLFYDTQLQLFFHDGMIFFLHFRMMMQFLQQPLESVPIYESSGTLDFASETATGYTVDGEL